MTDCLNFNKNEVSRVLGGFFDKLILDYIQDIDEVRPLYQFRPDIKGLRESMQLADRSPESREILMQVLRNQYEEMDPDLVNEKIWENIELLKNSDTYTICTGHQLGIFSGPLYTIYKIASTIHLSRKLSESSGNKIIPVFWMASEDHDIDEIKEVHMDGLELVWKTEWTGLAGKAPCENFSLMLCAIKEHFKNFPGMDKWLKLLENIYLPTRNLSTATRNLINELFGKYGLLILDPDDRKLKAQFSRYMIQDVESSLAHQSVNATIDDLLSGYKIQAVAPEVNLFYVQDQERYRIYKEGNEFNTLNKKHNWTIDELKQEIQNTPEQFSPNVILRPLYQQVLLPNIAYIGGAGEIAYWLELKAFFEASDVHFPVLLLRNSFLIVDESSAKKIQKFGLSSEGLFNSSDEWIRLMLIQQEEIDFSFDKETEQIALIMNQLAGRIAQAEKSLEKAVHAEMQRIRNSISQLESKALRAYKKQNENLVLQLRKLKDKLFPGGKLQERTENVFSYLIRYDYEFIDRIVEHADPLNNVILVLQEEKSKAKE